MNVECWTGKACSCRRIIFSWRRFYLGTQNVPENNYYNNPGRNIQRKCKLSGGEEKHNKTSRYNNFSRGVKNDIFKPNQRGEYTLVCTMYTVRTLSTPGLGYEIRVCSTPVWGGVLRLRAGRRLWNTTLAASGENEKKKKKSKMLTFITFKWRVYGLSDRQDWRGDVSRWCPVVKSVKTESETVTK